jgi:eukaryotic-like serine/threonine-protein kinase
MPEFPPSELARGEKGPILVYLHLSIDAAGAVTAAVPISGREPFRSAASQTASTWRFVPARVDGRDVAVRDFLVPVRFSVASR